MPTDISKNIAEVLDADYTSITDLVPIEDEEPLDIPTGPEAQNYDLEVARTTLHELLNKGKKAIDKSLNLAEASESPRSFEVVQQLITTVSGVAMDLVNLHQKRVYIEKKDPNTPTNQTNIQNNMYLTPVEMLTLAKESLKLEGE